MSWQTKIYTKESLKALNPEVIIAERRQKIRSAVHEIQNEVLYRARRGETSASILVTRTRITERPDFMLEIVDRVKEMFPDSAIVYGTTLELMHCLHNITVSWS